MTRLGVPAALDGWSPEPVREFFFPTATAATLARVLEVGRWEEVVVVFPLTKEGGS